ncbi:MAG: hypothetical protein CMI79_03760 [Candidatus Pelagibacter sp.]|nr:hypothetical protein [Candidatus Pelagibacter sp.]
MCFNASVSISVFALGIICLGIMVSRKLYFFSVFYLFIIIMQLLEYFAHISLMNNDSKLNKLSASFALLLLVLQPVIFSLYAGLIENNSKKFLYKISPFIAFFITISILLHKSAQSTNTLRISYLNKACNSNVCLLEWSFFRSNYLLSCMFIFMYFLLFIFTGNNLVLSKYFYESFTICVFLLTLSLVYMTFIDKLPFNKHLIESFGSLWCIMATLLGPYVVFSTSK